MSFLFATSIETGYPLIAGGHRIDRMDLCGHYARWEEDFALVRGLGLDALRYGPAYYRVHVAPDVYDWETCDEPMQRLRELGVTIVADLCHYGVPTWLAGFQDPAFPVLFAEYARAFARRYRWVRHFTPVHRIGEAATRSALTGEWNEREASEGAYVRVLRNLCMAHELAVEAILGERPDAIIVQTESLERFHAAGRGAARAADHRNALWQLPLDLTLGHEPAPGMAGLLNAHGVTSNDLSFFRERRAPERRWLGVAFMPEYEQRVAASGRIATARRGLGFRKLALDVWRRYRLPLFVAETGRAGRFALPWLREQWDDTMALRAAGVPIGGFTWHGLTDRVEWKRDGLASARAHASGLVDLDRRERPSAGAYRALVGKWKPVLSVTDARDDARESGEQKAGAR